MIILINADDRPYVYNGGMATKVLGKSLPEVIERPMNDVCICDFIKCVYRETVFASDDTADYKNDLSEFLARKLIGTDTIAYKLLKDGVEVAELNDNTYGTLFDGFTNGNAEQQMYYGYLLEWRKVFNTFGGGVYSIEYNLNILGEEIIYESREFNLLIYSDFAADDTVKIETTQNGNIIGSEFDYTGLNWKQYLRVPGRFGNPVPVYETDRYVNENQNYKQIKDKMTRQWTLNTKLINWEVAEKLVYNKLLANQILITDYSIKAESIWRNISVVLEDIEKPEIFNSVDKRYNFTFVDSKLIYQKRNF